MQVQEAIPLSTLTTFKTGGTAKFVALCESVDDIRAALAFARTKNLPWYVLGGGSNVLAPDEGFEGVIIRPCMHAIGTRDEGTHVVLTADAGASWDALVREAAAQGLWGIENLAGIPGNVGAAPVQNIGAYGTELKDTFAHLEALEASTGTVLRMEASECRFGYRDSRFKRGKDFIILSVSLRLAKNGTPNLSYADLARAKENGDDLSSPAHIGEAVRRIRSVKFPDLTVCGTAGSFFKNPVISETAYTALALRYPNLPQYSSAGGIKVPLAFILDRVLGLKGLRTGSARLFEAQPLVLVLDAGGSAHDVQMLASVVEEKVREATGILIEREVRTLA